MQRCLLLYVVWALGILLLPQSNAEEAPASPSPKLVVQVGHTGVADHLSFGGRFLATSDETTIGLWDVETWRQMASIRPVGGLESMDFSAGGRWLAVVYRGNPSGIQVIDTANGRQTNWSSGRTIARHASCFFNTQAHFLAAGVDGHLEIWTPEGVRLRDIDLGSAIVAAAISADDSSIAISFHNKTIGLFRSADMTLLWSRTNQTSLTTVMAFHPHLPLLILSEGRTLRVLKVRNGAEEVRRNVHTEEIIGMAISSSGKTLATSAIDGSLRFWDAESFSAKESLKGVFSKGLAFQPGTEFLAHGDWSKTFSAIKLRDSSTSKEIASFGGEVSTIERVEFSPSGKYLVTASADRLIRVWDLMTGKPPQAFGQHNASVTAIAFLDGGDTLLTGDYGGGLFLWDVENMEAIASASITNWISDIAVSADGSLVSVATTPSMLTGEGGGSILLWTIEQLKSGIAPTVLATNRIGYSQLSFSPTTGLLTGIDGWSLKYGTFVEIDPIGSSVRAGMGIETLSADKRILARVTDKGVLIEDFISGTTNMSHKGRIDNFALNMDGSVIALQNGDRIDFVQTENSSVISRLVPHDGGIASMSFSKTRSLFATSGRDGTVKLWSVSSSGDPRIRFSAQLMITLVSFRPVWWLGRDSRWIAFSPGGDFDTNTPDSVPVVWRLGQGFTGISVDRFFREYYQPRLVSTLFAENREKSSRASVSLENVNRAAPIVKILSVERARGDKQSLDIAVQVTATASSVVRPGLPNPESGGVYDLHLLVDDRTRELMPRLTDLSMLTNRSLANKEAWRSLLKVTDSSATIVFTNVLSSRHFLQHPVKISAYAFNSDKVKSNTDIYTNYFKLDLDDSVPAESRVFILSIGVSESPSFPSLRMAAEDARLVSREFLKRLSSTNTMHRWDDVVPIVLISATNMNPISEAPATKKNIETVLHILAGRSVQDEDRLALPQSARNRVRASTFNDVVILFYSGHGKSRSDRSFLLIPGDATTKGRQEDVEGLSTDEVAFLMRDIRARQIYMILDACESAAAIKGPDFRPGPMGDGTLGQLAYDKQIYVLAAAQPSQDAIGIETLGHGLLTHALVQEGLIGRKAADGREIRLSELMKYTALAVPGLYRKYLPSDSAIQEPELFFFFNRVPGLPSSDDLDLVIERFPESPSIPGFKSTTTRPVPVEVTGYRELALATKPTKSRKGGNDYPKIAISNNGERVCITDTNGHVHSIEVSKGHDEILDLPPLDYSRVSISPSGRWVIVVGQDNFDDKIFVWDAAKRRRKRIHSKEVMKVEITSDEKMLALLPVLSAPPRFFSLPSLSETKLPKQVRGGKSVSANNRFFSMKINQAQAIFDSRTKKINIVEGIFECIEVSNDGQLIAGIPFGDFSSIAVWETQGMRLTSKHTVKWAGHESFRFLGDGKRAIIIDAAGDALIWNFKNDLFSHPLASDSPKVEHIDYSTGAFVLRVDNALSFVSGKQGQVIATAFLPECVWSTRYGNTRWKAVAADCRGDLEFLDFQPDALRLVASNTGRYIGLSDNGNILVSVNDDSGVVTFFDLTAISRDSTTPQ